MPEKTFNRTYEDLGYNDFLENPLLTKQEGTVTPSDIYGGYSSDAVGASSLGATLNFTTDIVFSATDNDTAAWTAGNINFPDGTATEEITSSNTGDITANTYIYYDPSKKGRLQTTTSPADAVGDDRTLLCVVEKVSDATRLCKVTPLFATGLVVSDLTANQFHANTITASEVEANAFTTSELNFTPLYSTDSDTGSIIGTINASSEGINIDADNIDISGSTTFSSGYDPTEKIADSTYGTGGSYASAGSSARIEIFPDANTGMVIYDDQATPEKVFEALVGGTDVGDVTIGDYASNTGLKWDKSASTFTVKGTFTVGSSSTIDGLAASSISGWAHANDSTTIDGGDIYTNTVTATQMSVTNLAAINADMGSITSGDITIDSSGYIQGGQTAYNTGTGFFLGYDTAAYKLSVGDSSGDYLTWDGSTLSVKGTMTVGSSSTIDGLSASNISGWAHASDATTIDGGDIYTNTVTATQMNVTNLAAINADMGSITSGDITIDSSGYIQGGQTGYNTGTGFFFGYDSTAYKLSIGNPSGDNLTWDGSNLTVEGDIQTASSGERVLVDKSANNIKIYNASNELVAGFSGSEMYISGDRTKFYLNSGKSSYIEDTGSALSIYSHHAEMNLSVSGGGGNITWGQTGYESGIYVSGTIDASSGITSGGILKSRSNIVVDNSTDYVETPKVTGGYGGSTSDLTLTTDDLYNLVLDPSGDVNVNDQLNVGADIDIDGNDGTNNLYLNDGSEIHFESPDESALGWISYSNGDNLDIYGGNVVIHRELQLSTSSGFSNKIYSEDRAHLDFNESSWGSEPADSLTLHGYNGSAWGKSSGWGTWGCNYSEIEEVTDDYKITDNKEKRAEEYVQNIFKKRASVWEENMVGERVAVRNKGNDKRQKIKRVLDKENREILKHNRESRKSKKELLEIADYEKAFDPDKLKAERFRERAENNKLNKEMSSEMAGKNRVSKLPEGTLLQMTSEGAKPTDTRVQTNLLGVVSELDGFVTGVDKSGVPVSKWGNATCFVVGKCEVGDLLQSSDTSGAAERAESPSVGTIIGRARERKRKRDKKLIEIDVTMM